MLIGILVVYLIAMFGVGVYANKFNNGVDDFLLAGRRLGVWLTAFTLAATYFGGGYVIGIGATAYSDGMVGWYSGLAGAAGILGVCLVLSKMEGMNVYTVTEIMEQRYKSPLLRLITSLLSLLALVGILAAQVTSAGSILATLGIGSPVSNALLAAAVFIGYTVFGGLWAVTLTDFIQVIIAGTGIIAAAFILYFDVSSWDEVVASITAQGVDENYFSMAAEPSYVLYLILPMFIYTLIGQDVYQRLFAASSPKVAKKAGIMAGILIAVLTLFPALLGIGGRALFPDLENATMVIPTIITSVLPPFIGGIVLSAVVAAIMSTADSMLTAATSHIVGDVLLRYGKLDREKDSTKLLKVSRVLTVCVGLFSVAAALAIPQVIPMLNLSYTIYTAGVFAPVVGGLLWKGATKAGAFAGLIGGLVFAFLGMNGFSVLGIPSDILSCLFSVIFFIIVSMLTQKKEQTVK